MRALLTGAGGFSGRHLLNFLTDQGLEVHTLGPRITSSRHHLTGIDDLITTEEIIKKVRPAYVFHLAGAASAAEAAIFYRVNTIFATTLLAALENSKQADCPVLLVGTSAEYGSIQSSDLPITETTPPKPYSHYGISKLAQTLQGQALARQGRPLIMVRPFNIIGAGMPSHLAVQSFARQIMDGPGGSTRYQKVLKVGNLNSTRDFLDIGEVTKVYWKLIQTPQAYGEIINVCSGVGINMGALLEKLIAISGASIRVEVDPARFKPVDIPVHYGSTVKLAGLAGYVPQLDLAASLKAILENLVKE